MNLKPQDLRIGNIVTVNNPKYHPKLKDVTLRITGVYERAGYVVDLEHTNQEPNTYYNTYSQLIEYVQPIPLTEELLLKCGFESINGNLNISGVAHINIGENREYSFNISNIKYLHNLQNILHELSTGIEIKL